MYYKNHKIFKLATYLVILSSCSLFLAVLFSLQGLDFNNLDKAQASQKIILDKESTDSLDWSNWEVYDNLCFTKSNCIQVGGILSENEKRFYYSGNPQNNNYFYKDSRVLSGVYSEEFLIKSGDYLQINYSLEAESLQNYDLARLKIKSNQSSLEESIDLKIGGTLAENGSKLVIKNKDLLINLDKFVNHRASVSLLFDSVDSKNNTYQGLTVDSLQILNKQVDK